jgi:hypothetical protein
MKSSIVLQARVQNVNTGRVRFAFRGELRRYRSALRLLKALEAAQKLIDPLAYWTEWKECDEAIKEARGEK